jgi:hypothetical protein
VEVHCLKDIARKLKFFRNPRSFFEDDVERGWTKESPALAFLVDRMLA